MTPEQVTALVQDFGCYILEVGRRQFGGRYQWHDGRDQPVLVVGETAFRVAILAWDKVRGRLGGDEGDNIPFFYAGFAGRARQAVPGFVVVVLEDLIRYQTSELLRERVHALALGYRSQDDLDRLALLGEGEVARPRTSKTGRRARRVSLF